MANQPLPFPAKNNSWTGFTREQLLANLKVAHANVVAMGPKPTSGDAKPYDGVHYDQAGINAALTTLFHNDPANKGKTAPSLQDNLKAAG